MRSTKGAAARIASPGSMSGTYMREGVLRPASAMGAAR